MHARIDQLLSLRDGEPVATEIRAHVQECVQCAAELARLDQMRTGLQGLPALEAPPISLTDLAERSTSRRTARRAPFAIAASIAAVVACGIAFVVWRDAPDEGELASSPQETVSAGAQLAQLMAQSRQLEEILADLPERPSVQRASLAMSVDSLEQRIQWLDWQLAYSSAADSDGRVEQRLWSERVELMDSLVKVRYAESAPLVF
jgi:hypothetical protein